MSVTPLLAALCGAPLLLYDATARAGALLVPAVPSVSVPLPRHEAPFEGYQHFEGPKPGSWRYANDHAARPGGHESHGGAGGTGHGAAVGMPGDPTKVSRTVEIGMGDDMRFKPASVTVKKGETIRFLVKNNGRLTHEMVLGTMKELKEHAAHMRRQPEMAHEDPNAVSVEPGKTGTLIWQFTKAGRFDFACLVPGHFEAGMVGKVVVNR